MKKILSFLVMTAVAIMASAAVGDTFEVGYLKYEILTEPSGSTRGTVKVTGLSTSALSRSSLSLVIDYPVTYNGIVYQTKEIGRSAFLNNKSITSVTIKWGIERIGQTAFGNCSSMHTIYIPSSVNSIDYRAIWYCKNLTDVYLATYDLTNLGYGQEVFNENTQNLHVSTGAQTLIIKNSGLGKLFLNVVETPEANDFYFADGSQILVTGRSGNERACTIIGYKVGSTGGKFSPAGTFSLPAHDINFKVTKIAHSAIKQNSDLVEADLSKLTSLSEIEASAFQDCKNLKTVNIPGGEIMGLVFSGCSALSSVTLGDGVTLLGSNLFDQCTSLTSVTLPASVTTINSSAFRGASSLRSIIVNEACQKYASYDGALYNKDFSYIMVCPEGKTSITLHPNTQTMSEEPQSFVNSKLTSITFPYGMKSIRELGCPQLTTMYIPSSATDLKFLALYGCPKLSEVYCNIYNPMKYNVFFNDMASSINLYVPADQVQNYNDAGWNVSNVKILSTKQTYDYAFHLSYGDIYYTVTSTEACNVASSDFDGRTMVVGYEREFGITFDSN
ncbi:MAG: leucine-rich repeat protein, partial [Bacteroidales bacterium]|nr:leucine-rich repeat protein [Candidatus Sodaliphilus fimicaballi]